MPTNNDPRSGGTRVREQFSPQNRLSQLVTFGGVGLVAFVVDFTIYNVLLLGPLHRYTITAKVISVTVATIVAWLGNRYLTFRANRTRALWREGVMFAISNLLGLGIAALCLFVSHYVLGLVTPLADNIAANGVGLVLGTTFRYFSYRFLVFPASKEGSPA
jgi:putative flippase GtrA